MSASVIQIENIWRTDLAGICRVGATVNGVEVWVESADTELLAASEVFASAFLVPAMAVGADLCVEGTVSTVWKSNVQQLMELFHQWWGYSVVEIRAEAAADLQPPEPGRNALFFTGGVDSFYSLLRGDFPVDDLVYVFGFDLSLDQSDRLDEVHRHLLDVAASAGKPLRVVKTNLRMHPLFRQTDWGQTHGGALASVAHALAGVSSVVISSSYSRWGAHPWGSHWEADPLWSSGQLQVGHFGEQVFRSDKLAEIAAEPLVQKQLRVCWKNLNDEINCCQCEKCVRTMLLLKSRGQLEPFETFAVRDQLSKMIRRVRYVMAGLLPVYEEFLNRRLSPAEEQAVKALLRRSRRRQFRKTVLSRLQIRSRAAAR